MRDAIFLPGSDKKSEELKMKKPELLAPAGDFEKLRTALHYGADAVYIGDSRFSLRGKAGNFQDEQLRDAVAYAHAHNARAYVTANIFAHNRDLREVEEHVLLLKDIRPDAVIVSDPGIFRIFRRLRRRSTSISVPRRTSRMVKQRGSGRTSAPEELFLHGSFLSMR
jgi:putative protease